MTNVLCAAPPPMAGALDCWRHQPRGVICLDQPQDSFLTTPARVVPPSVAVVCVACLQLCRLLCNKPAGEREREVEVVY
uniref:Uncharacterized protein n=1 Tax=Timema cristinae TaxID=61476 RepID=A0A7R9CQ15_TIMCR|nr:unnamed protein product [Timema cristinae]